MTDTFGQVDVSADVAAVDRKVNIVQSRLSEISKAIALLKDTDSDLRDRISRLNANKIDNKSDSVKDWHIDWGERHDQVKMRIVAAAAGGNVEFYTRTLSAAQNAYVMLGSWDITTTGYVNKMACVNTGKSTDEAALYYHFCAQKDATGGNWYKTFSIKKQDTAGPEIGIEINVSATTAQIRIATYRAW